MKFCNNCMGSCIHLKIHSNLDDGFYCDKNPEGFKKWHEGHRHHPYSPMDCYEGENTLVVDWGDGDVLGNFVSSILSNTKPLDSDISKLVDDNFWDLV